jgi:hypothetical protein
VQLNTGEILVTGYQQLILQLKLYVPYLALADNKISPLILNLVLLTGYGRGL